MDAFLIGISRRYGASRVRVLSRAAEPSRAPEPAMVVDPCDWRSPRAVGRHARLARAGTARPYSATFAACGLKASSPSGSTRHTAAAIEGVHEI